MKTVQPSFAQGEISPELHGRIDTRAYQSGLATAKNAIVHVYGGVSKRPGLRFVNEVKNSNEVQRLIPFVFRASDTYIIEMGAGYFRFYRNNALIESAPDTPYEVVNTYTQDELKEIRYVQNADIITFTHPAHPPMELRRTAHTNWSFVKVNFVPDINLALGLTLTVNTTGAVTDRYRVTVLTDDGVESMPILAAPETVNNINAITLASPAQITTNGTNTLANGDEIQIDGVVGTTILNGRRFTVRNRGGTTFDLYTVDHNPVSTVGEPVYVSGGTISKTFVEAANSNATRDNTISWTTALGARRYSVYRRSNGIYGLIGESDTATFLDSNIAPTTAISPPVYREPFIDNNPTAVGLFQQRRVFGGLQDDPSVSEFSKTGSLYDFSRSFPLRPDDGITTALVSNQVNAILHYQSLRDLLVFTNSSEWTISPDFQGGFTPDGVRQAMHSSWGCGYIAPLVVDSKAVFTTGDRSMLRDFGFDFQIDGYTGADLSIMSRHLLRESPLVAMSQSSSPESRVYGVREDGTAVAVTIQYDQEVVAWSWLETNGLFKDVQVLPDRNDDNVDTIYWIVERVIDETPVKYIEYFRQVYPSDVEDAFFVDSGLSYNGVATDTFLGLGHLEGEAVSVLADGNVVEGMVVDGGSITLPIEASVVHVGLGFVGEIKTLPLEMERSVQGELKRISKVSLRFFKSRGLVIGTSEDDLVELKQREFETMGSPIELFSGDILITPHSSWNRNGQIIARCQNPLPFTILSVVPFFEKEDDFR